MRLLLALIPVLAGPALIASAQTPAEPPAPAAPAAAPANVPTPAPNYVYAPDGRRDPFVSLVTPGIDKQQPKVSLPKQRPDGIAGVSVDDIVVRGLVESRGGWLAMIGAPSGKTYSIRPGDKLFDGNVRSITPDAVVLMRIMSRRLCAAKSLTAS